MIKLPVHFDLINEIIYKSILIIIFGLGYLFAMNLLRFNWYTVFFAIILFLLVYFKKCSYFKIEDSFLRVIYFKYYKKVEIRLNQIDQCVFYNQRSMVEIKLKNKEKIVVYLKEKDKEKLLNWTIKNYPSISLIYI